MDTSVKLAMFALTLMAGVCLGMFADKHNPSTLALATIWAMSLIIECTDQIVRAINGLAEKK